MTTWFISDLHLGHKFVAGLRGFDEVGDHDAAVMTSLDCVTAEDVLWVLGDVTCTHDRALMSQMLTLLMTHPARKHLVAGNHDPVHPMHREAYKWIPFYHPAFQSIQPFARVRIAGTDLGVPRKSLLLSHFPYSGDSHDEDRYAQYRLPDLGLPLVHGHTHSSEILSRSREDGGLQINVCWEAWHGPVKLDTIVSLLDDPES
jgi:calcineurin-like phosphoesterase family protein